MSGAAHSNPILGQLNQRCAMCLLASGIRRGRPQNVEADRNGELQARKKA
jgi:hypothetical protein